MKATKRLSKVWMFITLLILSFSTLRLSDIQQIITTLYPITPSICVPGNCELYLVSILSFSFFIWFVLNILFTILGYYCMIWTKFWIYRESK